MKRGHPGGPNPAGLVSSREEGSGSSLVVQAFAPLASSSEGPGSIAGWGTKSPRAVRVCVTHSVVSPWTVAHQAPLSMEFSRQQY